MGGQHQFQAPLRPRILAIVVESARLLTIGSMASDRRRVSTLAKVVKRLKRFVVEAEGFQAIQYDQCVLWIRHARSLENLLVAITHSARLLARARRPRLVATCAEQGPGLRHRDA